MSARTFTIDVESTGTADLKKVGAAAYWAHPDTQIICVCYAADDGPVQTWRPGDAVPYFVPELDVGCWRIVAHNWLFEFNCWRERLMRDYGWGLPRMAFWDCTMARSLYWGLPAGLGMVCDALALPVQKDASARSLMLRMSKPRTIKPALTWWHDTDPAKVADLIAYCKQDVEAERALDAALPPLPPREREIFLIDGAINQHGICVDLPLIDTLDALVKQEGARLNADLARVTSGRVRTANQTAAIAAELAAAQCPVSDLTRGTVAAFLGTPGLPPHARRVLEIRQEAAKASTAKLSAMRAGASTHDSRCRGMFQYGGAGRTLRWAGRRVQPQNYPRGSVKNLDSVFRMLAAGPVPVDDLALVLPGTVMDGVSSMLRGCFVAPPGHALVSGDLSQIEARVVAWLAGQQDLLDVFAKGDDVYTYTASKIGSDNRQLGKVLVLACGFGMGPGKFQDTALTYGLKLSAADAEASVLAWRESNAKIVSLWYDVDRAAKLISASRHGATVSVGRITFRKTRKALRIVLPSGRELTYQNVELAPDEFGRDGLSYMGVHPKTKKWERIRTYGGRLVENIVQATARDVMAEAMIELHGSDFLRLIGTVHDELIAETAEAFALTARDVMLEAMRTTPAWAPGLPVDAAGWTGPRYRK